VVAGNGADDPHPSRGPSTRARHHGLGAGFIEKDDRGGIDRGQFGAPLRPRRFIALGGDQRFF